MSQNIAEAIHKDGQKKMSFDEREGMKRELAEIQDQLKQAEPTDGATNARPDLLVQKDHLLRRKRRIEEALTKDEDLIPKGQEKDSLNKRRKEIEVILKRDVPSEREQQVRPTNNMDFEKAVKKTMHYQQTHGVLLAEWKEIMRRLEPNDPTADDTRSLYSA